MFTALSPHDIKVSHQSLSTDKEGTGDVTCNDLEIQSSTNFLVFMNLISNLHERLV